MHRCDTGQNFIPDPGNGCQPPSSWSAYDAAMAPYMNGKYWSDKIPRQPAGDALFTGGRLGA